MVIHPIIQELEGEVTRLRQKLHAMPEIGYTEKLTQTFIINYLLGVTPDSLEKIAGTGVKAVFYAENARTTTAFRADIDGLSMTELNDVPYKSKFEGRMHACGHDGHTSVLLTLAKLISEHRDCLKENVVLLFQPAEEHIGGAKRMVEEGALESPRVDRMFGTHVWPDVPLGKIGCRKGPTMAQTCEFDLEIHGKSAHGASPQDGVDAIVAASMMITSLQTVITRTIGPYEKAVITIGKIEGGVARNIIADDVVLNGTVRSFRDSVHEKVISRIHEIMKGMETLAGCTSTFKQVMHYPVLDNPEPLYNFLISQVSGDDIVEVEEKMAAEDFSFYQKYVPALFFFTGIGGGKCRYPLHNTRFDFDEKALLSPLEVYRRILCIE